MASAGSCSSTHTNPHRSPLCEHDLETDVLTSHTELNPGRRFFCCPLRKWDDCNFFQLVDSPTPLSFCRNNCARRLKLEKDRYEVLVKQNALRVELLSEKVKLKSQELELLKLMHEDAMKVKDGELEAMKAKLEETINEAQFQKRVWSMIKKMVVVIFIVSVISRFVL